MFFKNSAPSLIARLEQKYPFVDQPTYLPISLSTYLSFSIYLYVHKDRSRYLLITIYIVYPSAYFCILAPKMYCQIGSISPHLLKGVASTLWKGKGVAGNEGFTQLYQTSEHSGSSPTSLL